MVKPMPLSDFRAVRIILEPEDFAWGPDTEPPPSDLIDEDTWAGIMHLADDVGIQTSNHQGNMLRTLYGLAYAWTETIDAGMAGDDQDELYDVLLDAHDEYDACIFNALHGYYRAAIGCLRNAIELTCIGTYCELCGKVTKYADWRAGKAELAFGAACEALHAAPSVIPLESQLQKTLGDSVFERKDAKRGTSGGWARRLYAQICKYSHSRPGFTHVDMWHSNGPVYDTKAFLTTTDLYLETCMLCFDLVKMARPKFELPDQALKLYSSTDIHASKPALTVYQYLFLK
jgi:hypothetical protein